jgi:hypothetical protein
MAAMPTEHTILHGEWILSMDEMLGLAKRGLGQVSLDERRERVIQELIRGYTP